MSQPSVASIFHTRKRGAVDESHVARARKKLALEDGCGAPAKPPPLLDCCSQPIISQEELAAAPAIPKATPQAVPQVLPLAKVDTLDKLDCGRFQRIRVVTRLNFDSGPRPRHDAPRRPRKAPQEAVASHDIKEVLLAIGGTSQVKKQLDFTAHPTSDQETASTTTRNAMDKVALAEDTISIDELKQKLSRSSRLAELKAALAKSSKAVAELKEATKRVEQASAAAAASPGLKEFKEIELEVPCSPSKQSPSKLYFSPRKEVGSPRKNLLGAITSPSKSPAKASSSLHRFHLPPSPGKPGALVLPFHYRCLAEMFRSIDTVCSMFVNRGETATFPKIKTAVQEMTRRNLVLKHLAQIKTVAPAAFEFAQEKVRDVAKKEKYELVIRPLGEDGQKTTMTPTCLLQRRRRFHASLVELTKDHHETFLGQMDPPLVVPRNTLARWHPEFDVDGVPEVSEATLPQPPDVERLTSGKEVLERARSLFNCNSRMEKALQRLKDAQAACPRPQEPPSEPSAAPATEPSSVLKGIPKALLERVRAKQAAKALDSMTRSTAQEKEALMRSRLPELSRLLRNTFITEKRGVLPLEFVMNKLANSFRCHMANSDLEAHLKLLEKSVPGWIEFCDVRHANFLKLSRDADFARVQSRLAELASKS